MKHPRHCDQLTPQERWSRFRQHLMIYLIVNAGLTTLNLVRRPDRLWFYWPLAGWGLGIALHAWIVFQRNRTEREPQSKEEASSIKS